MWSARWGINYVYAVGAVFPGLARLGYDMQQPWIANVTRRLMETQQRDGGFGEDQDSYNKGRYVEGATTASMTAWGLLAYLEVAHTVDVLVLLFSWTNAC
jgi:squalene-hopene/tetraprenyl-beta-curcumene cyclase